MDDSLIYMKTAAGELAVVERTRLIQRNLRIVLILIDGNTSVAALKGKVADAQIVDSAVNELEQMGLIELRGGAWRRKSAPEIQAEPEPGPLDHVTVAPAILEAPQAPAPVPAPTRAPEVAPVPVPEPIRVAIPEPIPEPVRKFEPAPAPAPVTVAPPTLPPETVAPGLATPIRAKDLLSGLPGELPGEAGEAEAGTAPAGVLSRWRGWREQRRSQREERTFEQAYHEEPVAEAAPKPLRRRGRSKMGLLPALAIGLVVLLVAGTATVALFPYDRYIPALEAALAKALGSSVKVAGLRFAVSPYPNLTVDRLTVGGTAPYAEVEAVRLLPDIFTVFSDRPAWQRVELSGVRLHSAGIPRATHWFADGSPAFALDRVSVSDLVFDADGVPFEPLNGQVEFDSRGVLTRLVLSNAGHNLQVEAVPGGGLFRVNVSASAWTIPLHPGVAVAGLDARGELSAHQLRLPTFDVRIFDGVIEGSAVLDWSDGASLVGDVTMGHTRLAKLLAAIDPELRGEGEIDGKARVETRGRSLSQVLDGLHVDGSFEAARVTLDRFDLVEAVRSGTRGPVRSGTLRADRLEGSLQCDERSCRIGNARLGSGLMRADGRLTVVRRDGRLDGFAQVEMKGTASTISAGVVIGGTLARPELVRR